MINCPQQARRDHPPAAPQPAGAADAVARTTARPHHPAQSAAPHPRSHRASDWTLTGPGGVGKTRLAIQTATELASTFPGGVLFVPLEAAHDLGEVAWAIAGRLATPFDGQRPIADQLGTALADRHLLLILDTSRSCPPPPSSPISVRAPRLTILATSRAPLHLSGEHQFPVSPLALPDPHRSLDAVTVASADAVALFLQRAAMLVAPGFRLTQNAPLVAEICPRLDGLPLALELAAARLKFLTPQEVLTRLKRRFTLLIGGGRELPDRQRTLRETVAWSYGLLRP